MIQPFVNRLKRWLADNHHNGGANGVIRIAKRNNGLSIAGAQVPAPSGGNKQRQRNASTGDLENVKTEVKGIPANRPKTVAAPIAGNNLTPITNTSQAKQKGNFKRQLFTTGGATFDASNALPPTNGNNNRLQSSNSFAPRPITAATRPPAAAAAKPQPSISYSDNHQPILPTATIPADLALLDANNKKKRRPTKAGKVKLKSQVRPIESFLQAMNADPAIQLWKNFTFTNREAITCTLPPFPKSVY